MLAPNCHVVVLGPSFSRSALAHSGSYPLYLVNTNGFVTVYYILNLWKAIFYSLFFGSE